jgi:hypothetical protein
MRTTQPRSIVRAMLREFVESNPRVSQIILTLRHHERYIVAWPWRPILRTAVRSAIKPRANQKETDFYSSILNCDRAIISIRKGHLVVLPVSHELELRVAVSRDYDVPQLEREIAPIVRSIGRMHDLI